MATWDLKLKLGLLGFMLSIALFIVAALGEFVFHWWNDLGLWLAVASVVLALGFGFYTSSRFQVRALGHDIRKVEANTQRIEANTQRIEANTHVLPEAVALLREIRDRLPAPPR